MLSDKRFGVETRQMNLSTVRSECPFAVVVAPHHQVSSYDR